MTTPTNLPARSLVDGLPARPVLDDERQTSLTAVEAAYRRLAPVYDFVYGLGLEHGRRRAMARLAPQPGERILEVGVGTGLSARDYPARCHVVAVDLSEPMLQRARARLRRRRMGHVALCRMDALLLAFPDESFDAVYAAYVLNVVADPVRAAREMVRVCRPQGRLVLLNHFAPEDERRSAKVAWRLVARLGSITWNLQRDALLRAAGLTADRVENVNLRISSVVTCRKSAALSGDHL